MQFNPNIIFTLADSFSLFYGREQRRRSQLRQAFANHIELYIRSLNIREKCKDYYVTELEAEVEASSSIPFFQKQRTVIKQEKSLSKLLQTSQEKYILLEGEVGSGKSVILRHIAQKLAYRSVNSSSIKSIIPLYIDLQKLERTKDEEINRDLIQEAVKKQLKEANDRDVHVFVDREFDRGCQEGTWLFLFDSFDKIPEISSATEANRNQIIANYGEAIKNFLSGSDNCRGIIASRRFSEAKFSNWVKFRILPLENRRFDLIGKANLDLKKEQELINWLKQAPEPIQERSKNPIFLRNLCEQMRNNQPLPQ